MGVSVFISTNFLISQMDKLVASIRSAAQKRGKDKGGQYEYDSDEDTEGGTWEHKKRQMEMHKTRGVSLWV